MKRNITFILVALCVVTMGLISCNEDSLPENSTLVSPISALVLEVNGADYVAVPQLEEDGSVSNTLLLAVNQPSVTAVVKQISVSESSASVNVSEGDVITFKDNRFELAWKSGEQTETFIVEMSYNPPPVMYLVMTGNGYSLNTETAQTIASITYNHLYEGYIDLTNEDWSNIGLVQFNQSAYYDVAAGLGGGQSYGSFTMTEKPSPGAGSFSPEGPWGNWITNGGNASIVSPGIWKINFNVTTRELTLLETQWAITGTAAGTTKAMMYDSETRKWTLTTELTAGQLKFTTIPVAVSDPTLTYGVSDGFVRLSETGTDISIDEAGTYRVELDLSTPFYDYSITK